MSFNEDPPLLLNAEFFVKNRIQRVFIKDGEHIIVCKGYRISATNDVVKSLIVELLETKSVISLEKLVQSHINFVVYGNDKPNSIFDCFA